MSDNTQDEDLIPINITIADRSYRVKISAKDEEAVRKTAALINQKMVEFKNAYAGTGVNCDPRNRNICPRRQRQNFLEAVD